MTYTDEVARSQAKRSSDSKPLDEASSANALIEHFKDRPSTDFVYSLEDLDLICLVFNKIRYKEVGDSFTQYELIPSLKVEDLIEGAKDLIRDLLGDGTNKDDSGKPISGALLDFSRALTEISKLLTFGAKKYSRSAWLKVANGRERYTDAMIRHMLLENIEVKDPETQISHDVATAWNALARLELRLRDQPND